MQDLPSVPDDHNVATTLNHDYVISKCDFFVDVQLWPLVPEIDPRGWLRNFEQHEIDHALFLLNAFTYYSRRMVDEMFVAAFQQLSVRVAQPELGYMTVRSAWQQFHKELIITHVEGEQPNSTDSGYAFARRARQLLGINERQILAPADALARLIRSGPRPVVFVDDFVGSGNQFLTTWQRPRLLQPGLTSSFAQFASAMGGRFFYCPLICTAVGKIAIQQQCSGVELIPVHLLDADRDGALGANSQLWPEHLRSTAAYFLESASSRAGIPSSGPKGWRGFAGLGLTVAFEHTVPDATLPIYYWEGNGWIPLIRRR